MGRFYTKTSLCILLGLIPFQWALGRYSHPIQDETRWLHFDAIQDETMGQYSSCTQETAAPMTSEQAQYLHKISQKASEDLLPHKCDSLIFGNWECLMGESAATYSFGLSRKFDASGIEIVTMKKQQGWGTTTSSSVRVENKYRPTRRGPPGYPFMKVTCNRESPARVGRPSFDTVFTSTDNLKASYLKAIVAKIYMRDTVDKLIITNNIVVYSNGKLVSDKLAGENVCRRDPDAF